MKTNKEIIIKILDDLDLIWPTSPNSKINKEKLVQCWSEYRSEADWKFYGYTGATTACISYAKIFKTILKDTNEPWKAYILKLNGYKYCSKCENLFDLSKFSKSNSNTSKFSNTCKQCDGIEYRRNNKDKISKRVTEYRSAHLYKINALAAKHRAAKLNRTPNWLTDDDLWLMQEAYSLSKEREQCTGIKWHVDHIIPLQGKLVSGLHVPTNLQVITAGDNLTKSNKYN